jgi:hypothetical protein
MIDRIFIIGGGQPAILLWLEVTRRLGEIPSFRIL